MDEKWCAHKLPRLLLQQLVDPPPRCRAEQVLLAQRVQLRLVWVRPRHPRKAVDIVLVEGGDVPQGCYTVPSLAAALCAPSQLCTSGSAEGHPKVLSAGWHPRLQQKEELSADTPGNQSRPRQGGCALSGTCSPLLFPLQSGGSWMEPRRLRQSCPFHQMSFIPTSFVISCSGCV